MRDSGIVHALLAIADKETLLSHLGVGRIRPKGSPRDIATREALKDYDPGLYALVHETMAYEEHVDWRYAASSPVARR